MYYYRCTRFEDKKRKQMCFVFVFFFFYTSQKREKLIESDELDNNNWFKF